MIRTTTYYTRGFFLISILMSSVLFKVHAQVSRQLSLEACVQNMVRCDINVTSLENLELISRLNKRIQQTGLLPSLSASGSYNQFIQNSSISYIDNILPTSTILNARSTLLSGSATASIDVTGLGRSIYAVRAAHYDTKDQKLETIQQKNALVLQVADLYTNCILSELTVEQLYKRVEDSKRLLQIASTNLTSGAGDSASFLMANINLENDKIAFQEASLAFAQLKESFSILLGLPISSELSFESLESTILHLPSKEEHVPSSSMDLLRLEFQLKQSINLKRSTFFNLFPSISFFGGYSLSDQRFQNGIFAQNKAFGPTYGLGVSYSLGQVKNAIHQSRIQGLTAENLSLQLSRQRMQKQAELNHLDRTSKHLLSTYDSRLSIAQASRSAFEKIEMRYEAGKINISEVRNSQNQLLLAEIALTQTLRDRIINHLTHAGDKLDLIDYISGTQQ